MIQKAVSKLGPADHGRPMSLEDFDHAETQEGYLYELGRGVITVSDVLNRRHLLLVGEIRQQVSNYRAKFPERLNTIAGSGECKLLISILESERHPDVAIYLQPPIDDGDDLWATWIPELVVEVVSPGSEERDYVEKREEYLRFGVREYWIVDADKAQVLVLRRHGGKWVERVVQATEVYQTKLLPDFTLDVAALFQSAR